eukprot:PhM_4_TR8369/c0_g1_i1/m.14570
MSNRLASSTRSVGKKKRRVLEPILIDTTGVVTLDEEPFDVPYISEEHFAHMIQYVSQPNVEVRSGADRIDGPTATLEMTKLRELIAMISSYYGKIHGKALRVHEEIARNLGTNIAVVVALEYACVEKFTDPLITPTHGSTRSPLSPMASSTFIPTALSSVAYLALFLATCEPGDLIETLGQNALDVDTAEELRYAMKREPVMLAKWSGVVCVLLSVMCLENGQKWEQIVQDGFEPVVTPRASPSPRQTSLMSSPTSSERPATTPSIVTFSLAQAATKLGDALSGTYYVRMTFPTRQQMEATFSKSQGSTIVPTPFIALQLRLGIPTNKEESTIPIEMENRTAYVCFAAPDHIIRPLPGAFYPEEHPYYIVPFAMFSLTHVPVAMTGKKETNALNAASVNGRLPPFIVRYAWKPWPRDDPYLTGIGKLVDSTVHDVVNASAVSAHLCKTLKGMWTQPYHCPRHKIQRLTAYCHTENVFVCEACVRESHGTHKETVQYIDMFVAHENTRIAPKIKTVEMRIKCLEDVRNYANPRRDELHRHIDDKLDSILDVLKARQKALHDDIDARAASQVAAFEVSARDCRRDMTKIQLALDTLTAFTHRNVALAPKDEGIGAFARGDITQAEFVQHTTFKIHAPRQILDQLSCHLAYDALMKKIRRWDWHSFTKHFPGKLFPPGVANVGAVAHRSDDFEEEEAAAVAMMARRQLMFGGGGGGGGGLLTPKSPMKGGHLATMSMLRRSLPTTPVAAPRRAATATATATPTMMTTTSGAATSPAAGRRSRRSFEEIEKFVLRELMY